MTDPPATAAARRFSVAPMMDCTDRHCRFFHRLMTRRALLYTEMVTAEAILNGDSNRLLAYDADEHPVALQIGGSDPARVAAAARIGAEFGYDEINLNCGCPSDRVRSGRFGACLMREPMRVAECVAEIRAAVDIPITVKCRIGIDDDPPQALFTFIEAVAGAGCDTFIVHARKAWLQGLSPKQNRTVPPLDHGLVAEVKHARPELDIILNGGIRTLEEANRHLDAFDGVMLGRAVYETPAILLDVDHRLFGDQRISREPAQIVDDMTSYAERMTANGVPLHAITRHMLGLFKGAPGARRWRRLLAEGASRSDATPGLIREAFQAVTTPYIQAAE